MFLPFGYIYGKQIIYGGAITFSKEAESCLLKLFYRAFIS